MLLWNILSKKCVKFSPTSLGTWKQEFMIKAVERFSFLSLRKLVTYY